MTKIQSLPTQPNSTLTKPTQPLPFQPPIPIEPNGISSIQYNKKAISWIPKGVSKSVPEAAEPPSKEEIEMLIKSGILDGSGDGEIERDDEDMDVEYVKEADEVAQALLVANALEKSSKTIKGTNFQDIEDGLRELDMDNYDEEDDDGIEIFSKGLGTTYYPSNDVDPYLKDKDGNDSEDLEDMIIKAEDSVIICACNEDDVSHLEIWILEDILEGDRNMFIHHDIMLPAFPLCMAWLDCPIKGGEKGNFIAVGSMEPAIEIWDLDIMDEVQPSQVLGGIAEKNKKKKKGNTEIYQIQKGQPYRFSSWSCLEQQEFTCQC